MKNLFAQKKFSQWLTVITISLIISTINIIHVIYGLAKTPAGSTYLATGHYYLDYFEYLQHIAAGIAGRWLPTNYFTTSIAPIDWRYFPYILLGKVAWIFHLSPMLAYWLAVFFLTLSTLIGFYYIIDLVLNKEAFYIKIIAFLMAIFSGPVYKILINNGQLILNPYDFWYGPATFMRRFEVVPYHALGLFLLLLIVIAIDKIWKKIPNLSSKEIVIKGIGISLLLAALMSFSPIPLASLLPALIIVSFFRFIRSKNDRIKIFIFNFVLFILLIPVAYLLRHNTGYGGLSFEVNWIGYDPWWFFLLNLGPIVLFFPFGLKDYLKENNFLKQILLFFTIMGFCLYVSPVAYYLGIHNLRFFSSISYIFYGVLAVLGIKKVSFIFKKHYKVVIILISSLIIIYSGFLTVFSLYNRAAGFDASTPETIWTYLPNPIIEGLQTLRNHLQTNVLAGPYGGIGMFVPIISYKRVFLGHPSIILMPNIEKNKEIANLFYTGKMTKNEAGKFLMKNNIGYVILTSYDNYNIENLVHYQLLKQIYNKESIKIWKVDKI